MVLENGSFVVRKFNLRDQSLLLKGDTFLRLGNFVARSFTA